MHAEARRNEEYVDSVLIVGRIREFSSHQTWQRATGHAGMVQPIPSAAYQLRLPTRFGDIDRGALVLSRQSKLPVRCARVPRADRWFRMLQEVPKCQLIIRRHFG
jgi:hypothetical protein